MDAYTQPGTIFLAASGQYAVVKIQKYESGVVVQTRYNTLNKYIYTRKLQENGLWTAWERPITDLDLYMPEFSQVCFYLLNSEQELVFDFYKGARRWQIAFTQTQIIHRYFDGNSWKVLWSK